MHDIQPVNLIQTWPNRNYCPFTRQRWLARNSGFGWHILTIEIGQPYLDGIQSDPLSVCHPYYLGHVLAGKIIPQYRCKYPKMKYILKTDGRPIPLTSQLYLMLGEWTNACATLSQSELLHINVL